LRGSSELHGWGDSNLYPVSPFLRVASSQLAANLLDTRGFLASTGLTAHLFLDEFLAGEAKGESTQGAGRSSITKRKSNT
jgi:hypothetical protein